MCVVLCAQESISSPLSLLLPVWFALLAVYEQQNDREMKWILEYILIITYKISEYLVWYISIYSLCCHKQLCHMNIMDYV